MTSLKTILFGAALMSASPIIIAAEKVVTLGVDNMTCISCPYQVQKSLTHVDGVSEAEASLETGQAVVTYDDSQTNVEALVAATTNAGFPSQVVQ
jgi:mercuric ion binding protein